MKLGKNPNRKRMRRERERKKQQLIIVTLSHWHCFLLFSLLLGSPPLHFVEVVMLKVLFFPHSHSLSIFLFYTYFFSIYKKQQFYKLCLESKGTKMYEESFRKTRQKVKNTSKIQSKPIQLLISRFRATYYLWFNLIFH